MIPTTGATSPGSIATNQNAYISELLAIRALLPSHANGLEIGVGTGRFAAPSGVGTGLDPSSEMLAYAKPRGIVCVQGIGEEIPFLQESFDYILLVTTICFVDNPGGLLAEARRVLKPGGVLVIGFIDRTGALGSNYCAHKEENLFYRVATFYSPQEVEQMLTEAGFTKHVWVQTLFTTTEGPSTIEALRPGYGSGAFVVVAASASYLGDHQ